MILQDVQDELPATKVLVVQANRRLPLANAAFGRNHRPQEATLWPVS